MRLGVLARNEVIKVGRYRPLWFSLLAFVALAGLGLGGLMVAASRLPNVSPLALPSAWPALLGLLAPLRVFFVVVTLILLVAGEFSWSTASENLIAGLSRGELFASKLMLVPAIVLLFFGTGLVIAGGAALIETPLAHAVAIRGSDVALMGRSLVSLLGYACLALIIGVGVRRAGGGIGVFFAFILSEDLVGALLRNVHGVVSRVPSYFPTTVFSGLREGGRLSAQMYLRAGVESGSTAPGGPLAVATQGHALSAGWLLALTLLYSALFAAGSYLLVRNRDP